MNNLYILNVEHEHGKSIVVSFSDGTRAVFTVEELAAVRRFRGSEIAEKPSARAL